MSFHRRGSSKLNRLLLAFTAPALGTALAVAGLSLSGTVAAKTHDRPPVETSKVHGQFCELDDDAKSDDHRSKERLLAKDGRDTLPGSFQLASRRAPTSPETKADAHPRGCT